ncbi:hypothetical protein G4Y79_11505 [Phototrophicus methaneseepsis]|uniref:Polysaccharide biosynthesis protein n=1 Tax=Phototrophicus methaneseepsis TaxID=2710758 RepID=A0A7S8EDI2_9CHLR|nr:hypothetical protein [Phototrophicus methaneseepsis]QPC84962.1 hypothetical protein G4Y79_11505 [Phototrophicus methaneseepsis]
MSEKTWRQRWQQAQSDPYHYAVMALLLLNGLQIYQIEDLAQAQVDLDSGWLRTTDNHTFPLSSYTRDALAALYESETALSNERILEAVRAVEPLIDEAHRRLAGAIWITDEELQLTLETTGSTDIPILPLRFTFPFSISERLEIGETSEIAQQAQHTLQSAADWLVEQTLAANVPLPQRILGLLRQGSLVFLVASTGVSGLNLIHNVLMGRLLSPADYSQLTFIITLQLLIGLLPTALQTVAARFTARYQAHNEESLLTVLYHQIGRFSWIIGLVVGVIMLILSPLMIQLFQLDGLNILLPVVVAIPFFVRMGPDRGLLQGISSYYWLSVAYVMEGVIRLGIGVILGYALLAAGRSLEGAVWGVAEAMLVTWFISWLAMRHFQKQSQPAANVELSLERKEWQQLAWMTGLVLIGQALITNSDFLLVKNFFSPQEAGLYAAVSVLGRIVYFGALPLTILLVPLIARRQALGQPTRPILMLLIGGGVAVCSLLILVAAIFAPNLLGLLYGEDYIAAASLLPVYALAASLYTLTNLVITYQIALGSGGETWLPILAGTAQVVLVLLFHESLAQVITIQILLMGGLFGVVLWRVLRPQPVEERDHIIPAAG